jgi:hypothetical protein
LPGSNRLPGNAVQFSFALLYHYQNRVRHRISSQFPVLR